MANNEETNIEGVFFSTFIGENVEVLCKTTITQSGIASPIVVQGILLDIDENYYYFSDDGTNVSRALAKNEILFIEIIDDAKSQYSQMLESLTIEKDKAN